MAPHRLVPTGSVFCRKEGHTPGALALLPGGLSGPLLPCPGLRGTVLLPSPWLTFRPAALSPVPVSVTLDAPVSVPVSIPVPVPLLRSVSLSVPLPLSVSLPVTLPIPLPVPVGLPIIARARPALLPVSGAAPLPGPGPAEPPPLQSGVPSGWLERWSELCLDLGQTFQGA